MPKKSPLEITLIAILLILFTLVLVRVLAPFRFALLAFFSLLALGVAVYCTITFFKNRRYGRTIEGNLEQRIEKNEVEITRLKKEITELRTSVIELQQQLKNAQLNASTRNETERLRAEFAAEISLRETKIQFFQTTISKLTYLLNNHRQTKILAAKQKRLKALRTDTQTDLPQLEQLQLNLKEDELQLEQIETLTLKMLNSDTLSTATDIQKELEILTRKINT
ncbi:MAG: hypothetical protein AB8G22_27855 [Saprospiraceae bacterium]